MGEVAGGGRPGAVGGGIGVAQGLLGLGDGAEECALRARGQAWAAACRVLAAAMSWGSGLGAAGVGSRPDQATPRLRAASRAAKVSRA